MKKLILWVVCAIMMVGVWVNVSVVEARNPPNYDKTFVAPLKDKLVFFEVNENESLKDNFENLFFPVSVDNYGWLWNIMRTLAIALILIYVFYAGLQLVVKGKKLEDLKNEMRNLWYISLGAIFIYGAGWLFWPSGVFDMSGMKWIEWVVEKAIDSNSSFFFQFLSLLKAGAFFWAILTIVITGVRVITAWEADKSKKLVKWTLNVVWGLALMKIVDFVYYMASVEDFVWQASAFILQAAKFCGYIYGAVAVIMVFYAGFRFLTDGGAGEWMKKAKTILINLFVSWLALFGFLLILYQVFAQFGG